MTTRHPLPIELPGLPRRVRICEVGARDGLQNERVALGSATKLELLRRLGGAGLGCIEATSLVRPDVVPQLADAEVVWRGLDRLPGVRYPVLVPNMVGLERALALGVEEIAVFASATESFARANLNRSLPDSLTILTEVARRAVTEGLAVRGYISMCFGDPAEGAVSPAAVGGVAAALFSAGCHEVSIGDTIGVATPGQVNALLDRLVTDGAEVGRLAVHFHDTFGQALANTLAALSFGVSAVDASVGGLGGCPFAASATGNLATEDLCWQLDGLGIETGVDLDALVDTADWITDTLGRTERSRTLRALRPAAPAKEGE